MNFLSLYTGIGLHDLGLERAGHRCVGQVEIDPFCNAVLAKHWPNLSRWQDVRHVTVDAVRERCGAVDLITGGFMCTDISAAGKGAGLGRRTRSGLTWREMFRLVRGLRPAWLVIENVPALRGRGADRVIGVLERIGYACWPTVVGAEHVGAPHRRHRVWIVGHSTGRGRQDAPATAPEERSTDARRDAGQLPDGLGGSSELADAYRSSGEGNSLSARRELQDGDGAADNHGASGRLAHPASGGQRTDRSAQRSTGHADGCGAAVGLADAQREQRVGGMQQQERGAEGRASVGRTGPGVGLADARESRLEGRRTLPSGASAEVAMSAGRGGAGELADAERLAGRRQGRQGAEDRRERDGDDAGRSQGAGRFEVSRGDRWPSRPGEPQDEWEAPRLIEFPVGDAVDGRSARLARSANKHALRALGNANPPQVTELIGRWLATRESEGQP